MAEYVVGVESRFYLFEPREICSPVRVRPLRQVKVAVIHIGGPRDVRAHRRIKGTYIAEALRRVAWVRPRAAVLNAIEGAAVGERRRLRRNPRNRAAIGVADYVHAASAADF